MANLVITAKVSALNGASPPTLLSFKDEDKRLVVAMPEMAEDDGEELVKWTVPDTPANRAMFRQYYKGDLYSCESIDLETPEPFSEGPKSLPITITPIPNPPKGEDKGKGKGKGKGK